MWRKKKFLRIVFVRLIAQFTVILHLTIVIIVCVIIMCLPIFHFYELFCHLIILLQPVIIVCQSTWQILINAGWKLYSRHTYTLRYPTIIMTKVNIIPSVIFEKNIPCKMQRGDIYLRSINQSSFTVHTISDIKHWNARLKIERPSANLTNFDAEL